MLSSIEMFNFMWPLLAALMVGGYSLNTASTNAGNSSETLASRSYFYVGGEYVHVYIAASTGLIETSNL